jgi:Concanavalin A-like lectin/glucanases superfamily
MPKDEQRASGPQSQFVWDSANGADGAAETPSAQTQTPSAQTPPAEPRDAVERRGRSRRRSLLIGSGVLVLVAGAVGAAGAFSAHRHSVTTGTAAMTLPSTLVSNLPTGPSTRPYASRSATPNARRASPSAQKNTGAAQTRTSAAASNPRASSGSGVAGAAAVPASPARPALPAPAGEWLLNQTTGNTAVDSTGAHNGWATDGWFSGTCLLVNGTNSQMYTDGPVLATGSGDSFTVSAWVDMTALPPSGTYDETAVSQDGGTDSGFYLQYTEPADRWAFSRAATDSTNPNAYRALSASAPSLGTWTHLVGVYNAANDTEYLYVDGVQQGTATDPTPFAAPGDLAVGRAQYNGQDSDWLKGGIKQVEVFNTALDAAQVAELS